jgi:hypothetical protein
MNEDSLKMLIEERYETYKRGKPYGKIRLCYRANADDPYVLEPDPEKIKLLEEAFDLLDNNRSYREVGEWLGEKLLINVGHQTMSNAYQRHRVPFHKGKVARPVGRKKSKTHQKKINLKKTIRDSQRELDKLNKKTQKKKVVQNVPIGGIVDDTATEIVFQPNPGPQTEFLAAPEQEVLYGGAAGGGKSYALLADPMRYFDNPNFSGLLLRRTNDELRELIAKSQELYLKAFPKARWSKQEKQWTFPSGARLWMTYLEHDDDVMRYQGQAFTWIAFDELTQYPTPHAWNYLRSRLRDGSGTLPLIQRGTTNPGGPGHHWVKQMFIDPAPPNTPFWATDEHGAVLVQDDKYPHNHPLAGQPRPDAGQPLFQRKFIPASLYDNPYLTQDGNYEASLMSLPEATRKKLLEGSWDIVDGAAFPEFNHADHVIEPFEIPKSWRRFRACDYGYSSHSAVVWFAVSPGTGKLVVYDELYVSKATARDLAKMIKARESITGNVSYGVLDSSAWHQRGHNGPSIAEEMISEGVRWRPSDRGKGSRTAGFNRLHELLKVDEDFTLEPGIQFFSTCRQSIAQIPALPSNPNGIDDIDDKFPNDHIYDAIRYGIMTRPSPHGDSYSTYSVRSVADGSFGY